MPRANKLTKLLLVLLIAVPAFLNFYTPLYNFTNPTLGGMPFFYWFQIVLLGSMVIPYAIFTYVEERRSAQAEGGG